MILAAGLTPALQQILVFDGLRTGHVNRALEAHLCASGKAINVGMALYHLGGPTLTLSVLGGITGEAIDREFSSTGTPHRWTWSKEPTRMCATLLDRESGACTELVENARCLDPIELEQFREMYCEVLPEARVIVLSGSLPAGTPRSFYRDLIEQATVPVVLDASGPELLEALPAKPFCAKPNREELARTLGREFHTDGDLAAAMHELCRSGATWVVVSHGTEALFLSDGKSDHAFRPLKVPTINPIGSGDCLAAGIAWGLAKEMKMPDAVRVGMAAAAENASSLLPSRLNSKRVLSLADLI